MNPSNLLNSTFSLAILSRTAQQQQRSVHLTPMTTAATRSTTHTWAFRSRFRREAFGWKASRLAIERIHDALIEIRAVARHDPTTAAEGAVLLLEKRLPGPRVTSTVHRAPSAVPPIPPSRNWPR